MYSYDENQWHVDLLNNNKNNWVIEIAWFNHHYFAHDENIKSVLKLLWDTSKHVEISCEDLAKLDIWTNDWNNFNELNSWLKPQEPIKKIDYKKH